jgi:hypothetical protein
MQRNRTLSAPLTVRTLLLVAATAAAPLGSPAAAQGGGGAPAAKPGTSEPSPFQTGGIYAGPRLWLGNLNGAVAVGGQVERAFTQPGQAGPGIIGAGIGIDWYSWSQNYGVPGFTGEWKYSVVPVQLFGNYHFVLKEYKKFDPYLGLALVYQHYSWSWSGSGTVPNSGAAASTTDIAGQAGARYFLNDKFAVQGQIGFGYGTLGLGATWKFGK